MIILCSSNFISSIKLGKYDFNLKFFSLKTSWFKSILDSTLKLSNFKFLLKLKEKLLFELNLIFCTLISLNKLAKNGLNSFILKFFESLKNCPLTRNDFFFF